MHNKALALVAMRVNDPDRSPLGINRLLGETFAQSVGA
jgi:hypothetical protein